MQEISVFAPTESELVRAEELIRAAGPLSAGTRLPSGDAPPCSLSFHHHSNINSTTPSTFDAGVYFSSLATTSLGRILFTAATTASTQAIIQDNIAKLPDGVLFVADTQVGGKGRGGNVWTSPPGCLMFSVAHRSSVSGQRLPFIQYLVTLAVVQAIHDYARTLLLRSNSTSTTKSNHNAALLDSVLRIKWPNDIYADSLKIGGVLCHSSFRQSVFHVTMGVGLNVSNREPTTCIEELLTSAERKLAVGANGGNSVGTNNSNTTSSMVPPCIRREVLLAEIMNRLEPALLRLCEDGFAPFEAAYYDAWLHSGQRVRLEGAGEGEGEGGGSEVTITGLSPHGYLMAHDDTTGESYELHPDGNSFDFFKGLVRKKIN